LCGIVVIAASPSFSDDTSNYAAILRALRVSLDLTQRAFGIRCGLSQSDISKIENGKKSMSLNTIRRIAREFHISVDFLLQLPSYPQDFQADVVALYRLDPAVRQELQRHIREMSRIHERMQRRRKGRNSGRRNGEGEAEEERGN
jgi:transcriptional regulator with XRE-family HTH domain